MSRASRAGALPLVSCAVFISYAATLHAQESTISLADVLLSVRTYHPPITALNARIDNAEGQRLSAEGGFDLQAQARGSLSVLGYYQYGRADVQLSQPTPFMGATLYAGWRLGRGFDRGLPIYYQYDETYTMGEARVGLQLPLLQGGSIDSRRAALSRTEASLRGANAEFDARILRIQLTASETYVRWVVAAQKYDVATALLRLAETRDEQIAERVAQGAIAGIEHLENQRAVLERQQVLVSARRAFERVSIALSLFLRDENGAPRIASRENVPASLPAMPENTTREQWINTALENRPELRRIEAVQVAARVNLDVAENQMLPRLDFNLQGSVDVGTTQDAALRSQLASGSIDGSLLLQLPFQFREARGRVDAARAELRQYEAELEYLRDTIRAEIQDAWSQYQAASENLALARASVAVAQQVAEGERQRFQQGLSTLFIVNMRESAAAQAEAARIDAEADLWVSRATLVLASGRALLTAR